MAAKKKATLSQPGQKDQKMNDKSSVMETAMHQEQFLSSGDDVISTDTGDLPEALNIAEHLDSGHSEDAMNINEDEVEIDPSDDTAIDEAVEPFINLDPALSIQNVVKLYEKIRKSYEAYDSIEIDASHVTSVDTATLQLFVALKKDALKQNKEVNFFQPSARFVESAKLLDLIEVLDIFYA